MAKLTAGRYGKAEVRLVRVARGAAPDGGDLIRDWNVSTSLAGEITGSYLTGDNSAVLPTDSQKNAAYAFAQRLGAVEPEAFALELAGYFVGSQQPITRARVTVDEYGWNRIGGRAHSFARDGSLTRRTTVVQDQHLGASVVSGIADLVVLNTTDSEFWGFPRDRYTTLPETKDRVLATEVTALWRYRDLEVDWGPAFGAARAALLTAFGTTHSYALQQTLFAMAEQIMAAVPQICEVRLTLPNKHHFLVDLAPYGQPNDNEVYYAADRPYGLIEGTVLADDAPDPGPAWD
jgi:urate oxidase